MRQRVSGQPGSRAPAGAQRSGSGGERRSGGMSEHLPYGGCDRYGARDAAGRIEGELKAKLLELRG